jgi:hypothetical protein
MSSTKVFQPRRLAEIPALRLALLLLGGVASSACGDEEPAPVVTAKQFANAVRAGDVEQVMDLMDSQAVARLEDAAQRASDQVGGRRAVEAHEMLQIVDVDPSFQVKSAELTAADDSAAVVVLSGADGRTYDMQLVNEDGQWRVRIAAPQVEES